MNVRKLYHTARGVQDLVTTEREASVSPSIQRRLWLWRRGFLSRSDAIFGLTKKNHDSYLTDYQRFVKTKRINGTWSVALSNKLLFHQLMGPFDEHRMDVYGMIRDGSFHSIDSLDARHELTDGGAVVSSDGPSIDDQSGLTSPEPNDAAQRVVDRLESESQLVLKWVHGGGGNNVLLCKRCEDGYTVNGDRYSESAFRSLVADLEEYLVCEHVEQGTFSGGLYPVTPNTLRIITMYDEEAGEPFIAAAIHRIGTETSEPLDNFTQGGLSAEIDLETGELGPGVKLSDGNRLEWHSDHPETDTTIDGTHVPGWEDIRTRLLEVADACSFVPYAGWDVIVTGDDGEFKIIEANSYPGMKSIQVHGPLLTDDRVRRFYERHNVC
ncbi:sugar-transfer associated ATP-grasp domain-containing protein [Natronorubrum daqingense]|uniref:Sugar-transfer associated ATP-grasp n=1 Tax=Natronorubrum daqingense TaxID=588898 RepID=A0A1N6YK36_9EURY|nr:sugar-transfer associated ATP-grasp domain-containing protein [Natronorubrum daqingense]APX95639.1 hypothetical protein BB347_02870 [Natronorubrum daqingense]SIR14963.1 Sugar-transfer associated ATP-grasp [Natronorubrum daqingense]